MRRSSSALDSLFPPTRRRLLEAVYLHPGKQWYRAELARHLRTRPSSLQRELVRLESAGVLAARREGNRTYYQANPDSPLNAELRGLVEKTAGIVPTLRDLLGSLGGRVRLAFIFGSMARGQERPESDVDLIVVGAAMMGELVPLLRSAERKLGRPVNAHTYTPADVSRGVAERSHFLTSVLRAEKTFVIGTADELEAVAEPGTR